MTLKVAIIGSGPAGYYTAEGLIKQFGDEVQIDIIDRLPTPYGLIRAGVAPDHQSIKAVTKRYEDTQSGGDVRFFGNIQIGDALTMEELRACYDAVVLATGAPADRPLGVSGDDLPGVIGAGAFVGWYNAHPDYKDLNPPLATSSVAVIGNGNVALDVARVLVKSPSEMTASDLARHAAQAIHASPIEDVYIIGRRGPLNVSFSPKELGELSELADAVAVADPAQMPPKGVEAGLEPGLRKVVQHIGSFASHDPKSKPKRIHFLFYAKPVQVMGEGKVTGLKLERTRLDGGQAVGTGETFDLPCGLVIPCIGYRTRSIPGVPFDNEQGRFINQDGVIASGLYCVGWSRRGPTGTIGTNRPDGFGIAEHIKAQVSGSDKPGRAGLERLIAERDLWAVNFEGWKRIEMAEIARARLGAPREKLTEIGQMLDVAKGLS